MSEPIYSEETFWKDKSLTLEIYGDTNFDRLSPVTQVQAVCFDEQDNVILYEHIEGWVGLPGGTIEKGESFEEALKRELDEEISAELIEYIPIGYFKIHEKGDPSKGVFYHLRYVAKVKLMNETPDPDGKALGRKVVSLGEVSNVLGWGKRGDVLIKLAKDALGY